MGSGLATLGGLARTPLDSTRALTRSRGWDAWLPLAGTPLCRFSDDGTPGHHTASEPTSSLNWGVPFPGNSPSTLTWQAVAPGPLRGSPVPLHCPRGLWHPGPRTQRVTRAHYLSRPPMDPWPTAAD